MTNTPSTVASITLTNPTAGAILTQNSDVTLVAVANPSSGASIAQVQFVAGASGANQGTIIDIDTTPPYTATWKPSTLGNTTLSARMFDTNNVQVSTTPINVTVVTQPVGDPDVPRISLSVSPSTITTLPKGAVRYVQATVTAGAGRAVDRVQFVLDGVVVAEHAAPPYVYKYVAAADTGAATLVARVTDNSGLQAQADITFTQLPAVGSAPTVNLLSPANNTTVAPGTQVAMAATAQDADGTVTSVQFYANGIPQGQADTTPPSFTGIFTPTTAGTFLLEAIATDDRNNSVVSNTIRITAAFAAPTVAITSPNPSSTTRLTPNVPLTVTTTATAGSGATILVVDLLLDGVPIASRNTPTTGNATSGTYTFNFVADTTLIGQHVLTTRATDTNSQSTVSLPAALNIANVVGTPPTITITAPTNNTTIQSLSTVNFTANTSASATSVEFYINDVSIGAATREQTTNTFRLTYNFSNYNFSALTPIIDATTGNPRYALTLYAIARDANGNQTVTPATTPLNLSVVPSASLPPAVSLVPLGVTSITAGTQIALGATTSDPDGTNTQLQLFSNGSTTPLQTVQNPQNPLLQFTLNTAGRFSVYAVLTDDTGNTSVSAPVVYIVSGNTAPSAVLNRPADDSTTTTVNTPVFLEATASDADVGQFLTVTFINTAAGGATVAVGQRVGTSDVYRAIWTPTQANTYQIAARATDSAQGSTNSALVRRVVVTNVSGIAPTATINVPNTTTTASTANFTATANDSDGSVIGVEFFLNRLTIGQAVRDQQTNTWRLTVPFAGIAPGSAEVVALVRDSSGNVAASPTSTITVNAASSIAPSITISPSTLNAAFNRQVQLTANARDTDGNVTNVQYFANATSIGNSGNSGTNFLVNWTPNQSGPFNIWAVATDNSGITKVAETVVVTVRRNNPVIEDAAFILQTYQDIANTTNINPLVFADLDAQLGAGTLKRADLVMSLMDEPGFTPPVNLLATYYVLMGQWPTPANYNNLIGTARGSLANAVGSILGSNEYFAKFDIVPTVALLNNANSAIPAVAFLTRLHQAAGLGSPSALDLLRFQNNNVASATIGRGYNSAGLNTAIAEFVTNTNSTNTALFAKARAAALFYQLNRPQVTVTVDQITAKVNALVQLGDTKAIVNAVLDDILYDYRYVTITKHPEPLVVAPRSGALFRVEAVGAPPLTYQWLLNGAPIPGATGSTLSLTNVDATRVGAYTVVITSSANTATSDPATLTLSTTTTRLANISTRGVTTGGANVLIGGFVVQAAANQNRQMLIRVVGPTLAGAPFNVAGVLADPRLEVYAAGSNTPMLTNDNWGNQTTGGANAVTAIQQATTRAGAFNLPNTSTDAVVLATLPGGNYTVQARGPNPNASGVVLLEVYDVTVGGVAGPKAANVSTRAEVLTGNNQLIAGFVVNGAVSRRMLIRGVGPTLQGFGLPAGSLLANPQISLIEQGTGRVIKTNDDWSTDELAGVMAAAATSAGAFPLANGSRDAAMIVMLPPGAYTVQMSGVNNGTGIGIVEVYDVDP